MTSQEERASRVYERTRRLANGNAWVQGLSGVFGMGANWVVDVAVIPYYAELWNDIRKIYGRGEITLTAATAFLKPNLGFLVQDLVWDKLVGSIPIVGIPFNIAFAKALTWRLGAWFGLLSALGDDGNPDEMVTRSSMQLTREIFPSTGSVFSFEAPKKDVFVAFIAAQDGITQGEAKRRMAVALQALQGAATA